MNKNYSLFQFTTGLELVKTYVNKEPLGKEISLVSNFSGLNDFAISG